MCSLLSKTHTRLETIVLKVFNRKTGKFEEIRGFLDHGSNRTYVTTECAKRCGLESLGKIGLYLSTFGNTAKKLNLDVAKMDFYQHPNKQAEKMPVNVLIKDRIVAPLTSFDLSPRQEKFVSDHNIQLTDPEAAKNGHLPVDILLGQDVVHRLTKGERLFLPGGSVLIPTWDGKYILAGPVDPDHIYLQEPKIHTPPNFLAVHATIDSPKVVENLFMSRKLKKLLEYVFLSVSSEEELEIVDTFRNLEVLGIYPLDFEISPILEEFDKSTTFENGRYTVKLPFKNPQIKKLSNNFFQAFQRLMSGLKRRLKPKFFAEQKKYEESFQEDLDKGILERVKKLGTVERSMKN